MPEHDHTAHLESRMGVVEQDLVGVKTDVSYIRKSIDKVANVQTDTQAAARTNWGTLAAWAAVILAITTYHGQLTLKPYEVESKNAKIQHNKLWDRNDRSEQWHGEHKARLTVLEALIQRQEGDIDNHNQLFQRVEDKLDEQSKSSSPSVQGSAPPY